MYVTLTGHFTFKQWIPGSEVLLTCDIEAGSVALVHNSIVFVEDVLGDDAIRFEWRLPVDRQGVGVGDRSRWRNL